MSVAIRRREVATLSARAEFLVVFRVGVLVVAGVWLYLASASATIGTRPGQRNLLPFQQLIADRPPDEQRMFRELQEGLLEAETIRSTTGAWPEASELAQQGIPPYAPDPTRRIAYAWHVVKSGVYINYVGVTQAAGAPGWLVLIQEPQPGAPPDPAAEDEDHHKLVNGPMLHVSIWMHADGRRVAPQAADGGAVKPIQMPQAEGWTQLYAKGPSATPVQSLRHGYIGPTFRSGVLHIQPPPASVGRVEDRMTRLVKGLALAGVLASAGVALQASSHREAPGITKHPKLDGTDFYMFRSYEAGRQGYVTLLANYLPLQDVYGGPNFFTLDDDGLYEIHIDNNGDAKEDITFQFRFTNTYKNIEIPVGDKMIGVPLVNVGGVGPAASQTANLNVIETYTLDIIRGDRNRRREAITNVADGSGVFHKPVDRIGDKSILNNDPTKYAEYANNHIYTVNIPGCAPGRVFVGQRREGFVVDLAEAFDLVNLNPLGPADAKTNPLADKNITTMALEVPIDCLVDNDPVIGGWMTSSASKHADDEGKDDHGHDKDKDRGPTPRGEFVQVSRLGHPLVNELVIGLKDKDKFNGSEPKDDKQFADYVTNPTLPALIEILFHVPAPATPRADLVQVFLTGVPTLNQPLHVVPSEELRLNTGIAPVAPVAQKPLGVLAGDAAGYPNGRRPGDDVVDIALRAVEGILLSSNPAAFPPLTDGAFVSATVGYTPDGELSANPADRLFRDTFPYLNTPLSGSPIPEHP